MHLKIKKDKRIQLGLELDHKKMYLNIDTSFKDLVKNYYLNKINIYLLEEYKEEYSSFDKEALLKTFLNESIKDEFCDVEDYIFDEIEEYDTISNLMYLYSGLQVKEELKRRNITKYEDSFDYIEEDMRNDFYSDFIYKLEEEIKDMIFKSKLKDMRNLKEFDKKYNKEVEKLRKEINNET